MHSQHDELRGRALRPSWRILQRPSLLAFVTLSACTFHPDEAPPGAGSPVDAAGPGNPGPDAAVPGSDSGPAPLVPRDVVHVPENAWFGADTALTWTADVTIDTTDLTLTGPGVAGGTGDVTFAASPQVPSGPELAILHVGDWTVAEGVIVRVVGDRPLVVLSSGNVELRGRIDAGAHGQTPGPGGGEPGQGEGAGAEGVHVDAFLDAGGGGAGHATLGARGGLGCDQSCSDAVVAAGGPGGATYGDPAVTVLTGGSGGGTGASGASSGTPCAPGIGGAGGGAVQLYAAGTITITAGGGISTGGGGGGGSLANLCSDAGGGGGGSGGAVYLQAARIELAGVLAANGGGGGGDGGGDITGPSGSDGALDDVPAPGGIDPVDQSIAGGAGAAGASPPQPGTDRILQLNGGGGGGAAGRVVLHCNELGDTGLTSPAAFRTPGCDPS
jgi:hypothetical protein